MNCARRSRTWEDNIKKLLKEIGREGFDRILLAQEMIHCWAYVKTQ